MKWARIRNEGTREYITENGIDRYNVIKKIVDDKQYAKVDNIMIDLTTANTIISIYNRLNDKNKLKLMSLPLNKIVNIVWKLVS